MARSIHRVSGIDGLDGRYVVGCDTPDGGRSTYPECWGAGSRFSERGLHASDSLADAVAYAESLGYVRTVRNGKVVVTDVMRATVYDRHTGREVGRARLSQAKTGWVC